ncbi:hypothetical protein EIN_155310 [Entamoeba invadens IP1]|uniref:Uncharacterized protein n=1 Tax=Entamoeba invadens IP1 TaxID=370355 RepID=A0A0A1U954_ENTIV|nr:hypothetical protein EIN_155310 [Entamoeba invadens IP1]ELP91424.1 hypothetical protein EIN_155310 [Entamoeba invadens IP1]|eukprot:XP_004258195.1 hypothetical protein EIN_155310 [Entamoeba invadens IP1]
MNGMDEMTDYNTMLKKDIASLKTIGAPIAKTIFCSVIRAPMVDVSCDSYGFVDAKTLFFGRSDSLSFTQQTSVFEYQTEGSVRQCIITDDNSVFVLGASFEMVYPIYSKIEIFGTSISTDGEKVYVTTPKGFFVLDQTTFTLTLRCSGNFISSFVDRQNKLIYGLRKDRVDIFNLDSFAYKRVITLPEHAISFDKANKPFDFAVSLKSGARLVFSGETTIYLNPLFDNVVSSWCFGDCTVSCNYNTLSSDYTSTQKKYNVTVSRLIKKEERFVEQFDTYTMDQPWGVICEKTNSFLNEKVSLQIVTQSELVEFGWDAEPLFFPIRVLRKVQSKVEPVESEIFNIMNDDLYPCQVASLFVDYESPDDQTKLGDLLKKSPQHISQKIRVIGCLGNAVEKIFSPSYNEDVVAIFERTKRDITSKADIVVALLHTVQVYSALSDIFVIPLDILNLTVGQLLVNQQTRELVAQTNLSIVEQSGIYDLICPFSQCGEFFDEEMCVCRLVNELLLVEVTPVKFIQLMSVRSDIPRIVCFELINQNRIELCGKVVLGYGSEELKQWVLEGRWFNLYSENKTFQKLKNDIIERLRLVLSKSRTVKDEILSDEILEMRLNEIRGGMEIEKRAKIARNYIEQMQLNNKTYKYDEFVSVLERNRIEIELIASGRLEKTTYLLSKEQLDYLGAH